MKLKPEDQPVKWSVQSRTYTDGKETFNCYRLFEHNSGQTFEVTPKEALEFSLNGTMPRRVLESLK